MRFFVTYDADRTSGLAAFLHFLYENGFDTYFSEKSFDDKETNICVVLMCRQPDLNFKQRIRLSAKDNTLYIDLMLDLRVVVLMSDMEKRSFVVRKMLEELPPIIAKYERLNFDVLRFSQDLRLWFERHGVVSDDFEN